MLEDIIRNFFTDALEDTNLLDVSLDKNEDEYYLKRVIEEMMFILYGYGSSVILCTDDTLLKDNISNLWEQMNNEQRRDMYNMSIGA
mgnify:CR=1 FL=1